jgi:ribonuclease HI
VPGQKFYVVWKGRRRGVFTSWSECERQVKGFVGAQYKAFDTQQQAREAMNGRYEDFVGKASSHGKWRTARARPVVPSVSVDAACSGSPGRLEFQAVHTESGKRIFREGPFAEGTNNVGEFLAIVEALSWVRKKALPWPVYSDSENAIGWVRQGKCRTRLKPSHANQRLFEMIAQAEEELRHQASNPELLKWDTAAWGEIPADFGRK